MKTENRIKQHEEFQQKVCEKFEKHGVYYYPYGIEKGYPEELHQKLMECGFDDPTAKFVRYMPDKIVVVNKNCFLCEIKSLCRHDTPNFSYELSSCDAGKKLSKIGVKCFVIFEGFKTCWVEDIEFDRVFDDPKYLASISRGSRTPFGLIRKDSDIFTDLEDFIEEELK